MRLIGGVLRSVNAVGFSFQFQQPQIFKALFSTNPVSSTQSGKDGGSFEATDDFERRVFGDIPESNPKSSLFFGKLDRVRKAQEKYGFNIPFGSGKESKNWGADDEVFDTLSDGMDLKLKREATYFEFDLEEVEQEDYQYRPDATFWPCNTYNTKDLDIRKPAATKEFKRPEFEVTTKEVLKKADFRNVRFLAKFLTESGIIIKRSQTKISAKAQRKVAREIKTARAFGLLPFTTMGTKQFVVGKTMEDQDDDYAYEAFYEHNFVDSNGREDPIDS